MLEEGDGQVQEEQSFLLICHHQILKTQVHVDPLLLNEAYLVSAAGQVAAFWESPEFGTPSPHRLAHFQ